MREPHHLLDDKVVRTSVNLDQKQLYNNALRLHAYLIPNHNQYLQKISFYLIHLLRII
jgi:hypothetical protein